MLNVVMDGVFHQWKGDTTRALRDKWQQRR